MLALIGKDLDVFPTALSNPEDQLLSVQDSVLDIQLEIDVSEGCAATAGYG